MKQTSVIPRHIAMIMDGNGRWAEVRKQHRISGHREGAKRVDGIVTECCRLGINYLTLYAFSTENWNRPSDEVSLLMTLLVQQLKVMDKKLQKNKVKLTATGDIDRLPIKVQKELNRVFELTSRYEPKMVLNLALSYGGRQEIVNAAKSIARNVKSGELDVDRIDEEVFKNYLYHPEIPDPDLLIRTAGEYRVSNFLLWEIAYTEFYITNIFWPDFNEEQLHKAIEDFSSRQRRFGKTANQLSCTHEAHL